MTSGCCNMELILTSAFLQFLWCYWALSFQTLRGSLSQDTRIPNVCRIQETSGASVFPCSLLDKIRMKRTYQTHPTSSNIHAPGQLSLGLLEGVTRHIIMSQVCHHAATVWLNYSIGKAKLHGESLQVRVALGNSIRTPRIKHLPSMSAYPLALPTNEGH